MTVSSRGADDRPARGEEPGSVPREPVAGAVLTFLIADVRGYTRFTQEHGDEEAGGLAARFAELVRETVDLHGGELIELRGDEALCVFGSARQAVRTAVELQRSFRSQTDDGPVFPLPIGVGLDAGEAVPIEGGYRGGALNTAARLCSLAAAGEILASDTVVSLARRLEGIRFVARKAVRLKGFEAPVRVFDVVPDVELPPLPVVGAKPSRRLTRHRLAAAAVAVGALGVALVAFAVARSDGSDQLHRLDANVIGAIDAGDAGIASQTKLASAPSGMSGGGGFLWLVSEEDGTVSRFEPSANAVQTLTLGGSPAGIAHGAGSLWVTKRDERALVQINPETMAVVQTFTVGNGPAAVAVGRDAVWVANTIDGTLSRVGLAEGSVTDTIAVGPSPAGVSVGAGAVWVASEEAGTVVRVDPASRTIIEAVNVGNGPTAVAAGATGVWVVNSRDATVSRIDPRTNSVSATTRVGRTPSAVVAGPDATWVASAGDGTISRIRPETGEVTRELVLGSRPSGIALQDGTVWATTLIPLAGHRGGVLRVEAAPSGCRCADPARWAEGANPTDIAVPLLLYDGLVAYRRVAGVAGGTLVPNLAVRLPTPTHGGRRYTFQLRRGIRYSDGTLVRASDFRSSLERLLAGNRELAVFSSPYRSVVGAAACSPGQRKRCNLSRGIEVDEGTGTITIRLTEPNPEFLYKLALPFASLVPGKTPPRPAQPVPGTGPYRVVALGRNGALRLVRNEHFRVWAAQARPDGFPDEIRFHPSVNSEASLQAVEQGKADWKSLLDAALSRERQRGVVTRHADRIHSDPFPGTFWWFLNTRVPPFDDVRVRRALNFATDRNALSELTGGLTRATCQILPPSFPGYRPHCPYTLDPSAAGTWIAPDLARARRLIAASGTKGMRVEVVGITAPVALEVARYFASLLRQLGYRTSLRALEFGELGGYVADSRNRVQIGHGGWQADSLAPSNFMTLFSCASFVPKSAGNLNLFQFCDPRLDAKMREATAVQVSDPVRANELWSEVDRALVDRAVAVPWGSPSERVLVSERAGNYQSHPLWGPLFDQLWVR